MASEQPYNELGQILSEGGEIALGLAILQDLGNEGFLLFFRRRFEPMREEDRQVLMNLADAMIAAGANLSQLGLGDIPAPGDIPINEWLFGGDLQGRRLLVTGEVEYPGAEFRVQLRVPFADIVSRGEMIDEFLDRAKTIVERYPEKFGLDPGSTVNRGNVYILLPERAW